MIPVEVLKTNQILFNDDSRYVDTKISIDGTITNFTMMMSFTKPIERLDEDQYIASSGSGDYRIALWHPAGEPDNVFSVQIGKNIFTPITVDPNRDINAMVCVYDKDTSEVIGSINGLPYQSFGPVDFTGYTNNVLFGVYDISSGVDTFSYSGRIGEGIFAATKEDEDVWFEFWLRTKYGKTCKQSDPELLQNSLFNCGLFHWKKNNYDVELTDNEDGTVHVKAIENYGSISPKSIPDTSGGDTYTISCKVMNLVGSGKMSVKVDGTWVNTIFNGDGYYEYDFSGILSSIDCGANSDTTAQMDFGMISLTKKQPERIYVNNNIALARSEYDERILNLGIHGFATTGKILSMVPEFCEQPVGQYLKNWTFDCGTRYWGFDSAYPAIITDNGDGSLHLKTDSNFGSLVPDYEVFPAANWVIEVKFRNQVGNGKISFRRPNNSWVSTPTIGDGVHQSNPFSGAIKEIHVGADGDSTYEADYEYISLRKRTDNYVTHDGDTIEYLSEPITYEG